MSSAEKLLRGADTEAALLGHAIVWTSIGERLANGACSGCGRGVTVASPEAGLREHSGRALQESCTRDYIMKKPSLQRAAKPAAERQPAASAAASSAAGLHT